MTTPTLQLTSASAWKPQTWITRLPSGNVVEIKKPNVFALITENGSIPDTMLEVLNGDKTQDQIAQMSMKEILEQGRVMLSMAKTVVPEMIVSVRVVTDRPANYEAGEIHINNLDVDDQIFLVQWAFQGGEPEIALARFLEEKQRAGVPAAQGFPAVRSASVPANGHSESDNGV